MTWPRPTETAILIVRNQKYTDWESVMVRHSETEWPFYTFRFTCSEPVPFAKNFSVMRIQPGDPCTIILAGEPAFRGLVHTRQVYYDAGRHYIEIQGAASRLLELTHAAVSSQTMEFNNVRIAQYVAALLQPYQIPFKSEGGNLPETKFPRISNAPGTTVADAIEIPLRSLGGINLTSNVNGDLVAIVDSPTGGRDVVEEGRNILEGREIIYNPGMAQGLYGTGQQPGGDEKHGAQVAHAPWTASMQSFPVSVPHVFPLEIPSWTTEHLKGRVNADSVWQYEDRITLFITVQGWLRPSGGLWYRNQQVSVISPMLIMQGNEQLFAKTVTFTQDNRSGTRTVLELCNRLAMQQAAGPSS